MLPTRDPTQNKLPTETKSKELEKNIPNKWTGKVSLGSNIYNRQNRLKTKAVKRDREGYFIILKGRIHQEDMNTVNTYASNIGAPRHISKILEDFKKDIEQHNYSMV